MGLGTLCYWLAARIRVRNRSDFIQEVRFVCEEMETLWAGNDHMITNDKYMLLKKDCYFMKCKFQQHLPPIGLNKLQKR